MHHTLTTAGSTSFGAPIERPPARKNTHFVVLQGALNSILVFFPAMPPSTVSGKVTSAQITKMITIVPKGSAAVDCIHANLNSDWW